MIAQEKKYNTELIIRHLHETPVIITSRVELDNPMKEEHETEGNFKLLL